MSLGRCRLGGGLVLLVSLALLAGGCGPAAPSGPQVPLSPYLSSPREVTATPARSPLAAATATPTTPPTPTAPPPAPDSLGLVRRWVWAAEDIVEAFVAGDFDGDGRPEYALASYDGSLHLVDAAGRTRWSLDTGGPAFSLDAADLDGDGRPEIVVGSDDLAVRAFSADGALLWEKELGGRVTAVALLDLRGDGSPEVLAGARPGGVWALAADGTLLWQQPTAGAPSSFLILGAVQNRTLLASTEEGTVQAFDAAGIPLWRKQGAGFIRTLVPHEGQALAGGRDGSLRRYNVDGEITLDISLGAPVASLLTADLDGDGSAEIVLGLGEPENTIVALDGAGRARWHRATEHGTWGLAQADLEGDGEPEIVAGTDGGQVLVLDHWGQERGHTWVPWRVHGLLVSDLDSDGRAEVLARSSHHLYALAGAESGDQGERQRYVETLPRWPEDALLLPAREDQVVLAAVGDLCLGRAVEERMLVYGPDHPLEALAPLLQQADIATGNLEGTLADGGRPLRKTYTFRAKPGLVSGLSEAGFNVLSLANNHVADFGPEGLQETMAALAGAGIRYLGAGAEAYAPLFLEVKGLRIAFLARSAAIAPQEGVAWAEEEELRQAVAEARAQADLVVVHLHGGVEYRPSADETQRLLAQAAADGGAALVIGHHAHAPQEVEWIGETLVAYGLGDFVFDIDDHDIARDAAVLRVVLSRQGVDSAEWIPVRIVDDVQPRPLPARGGRPLIQVLYVRAETALPEPPSPRPAYEIVASIFPATCTVRAEAHVLLPNTYGEPLSQVVLQVFPNLQPGVFRLGHVSGQGLTGYFSVEPQWDETMLHLLLPRALSPGEQLRLTLPFTLTLPPTHPSFPQANLGCSQGQVILGFWYPLLTPYRPGSGWQTWASSRVGDPFVLEIAEHTALVQVPAGFQVFSGGEQESTDAGVRVHLAAGRDLALVVGQGYDQEERVVGGVRLTSVFYREHRPAGEAALEAAAAAFALFEERYGPYPYAHYRMVEADINCGLEHSGMSLLGAAFLGGYGGSPLDLAVEVSVHELAHQWWYGVVGTDQVYEPWLDEGLARYSEALFYESNYPDRLASWWASYGRPREPGPSLRSTIYDFGSSRDMIEGLYAQAGTFLQALREMLGDRAFFTVLRALYRRRAFGLAEGEDLLSLARAKGGESLDVLVEQFFR